MRLLLLASFVPLLGAAACQPAAFPRTGDVVPRGKLAVEGGIQVVAYEPQRVTKTNGRTLGSNVAFFPIVYTALRVGIGGCEVGGLYAMTRVVAELRCGLVQERWHHPLSLALSGAFGIDYGYAGLRPTGRLGLDLSVRLGPIRPLANVYLSSGYALRWVEDHAPENPPIEGPLPAAESIVRPELRVTVPVGIAIDVFRPPPGDDRKLGIALLFGATPYWVIKSGPCAECGDVAQWSGQNGVGFTFGVEAR